MYRSYHRPHKLLQFNQKGEMNECNKHLTPGITCHLVCRSLPKQKQADERIKREIIWQLLQGGWKLDSQGTISLCPSNIYLGIAWVYGLSYKHEAKQGFHFHFYVIISRNIVGITFLSQHKLQMLLWVSIILQKESDLVSVEMRSILSIIN